MLSHAFAAYLEHRQERARRALAPAGRDVRAALPPGAPRTTPSAEPREPKQMSSKRQEPVGLLRKFDEDCARLSAVRDAMVRSLSSQHLSALQRQAVAMGSLQRDLKILQADLETVKEGLGEQLSSITAASKPHWKFAPVQRAATSTERDAALALQRRWRRRPRHTHGLQYSTAAVMQST